MLDRISLTVLPQLATPFQILSLAGVAIERAQADCYSRDGVLAKNSRWYTGPELQSCGRGTANCCLPGEKCGTNLLCSDQSLSRQHCASKDWSGCSQLSPAYSSFSQETLQAGLAIQDCGGNIVCYQQPLSTYCTNGPTFFVNPLTGEVKDGSLVDSTVTASPTYWDLIYTSSVASTSSTSSAQSTTWAATTSSYTSATGVPSPTSSTTSSPNSSSGLSPGAVADIGVGGATVVVGLGLLGWLLARRRRRSRVIPSANVRNDSVPTYQYQDPGKNGAHNSFRDQHPQEQVWPQELDQGRPRHEMQ